MPFPFIRFVTYLRVRSGKTHVQIVDIFEDSRPGVRDMGRWRKVTRRHYDAEFTRHCRERRFY